MERASSLQRPFRLTESNASAVTQVCAPPDGIPLAIEQAAGLDRTFSLLTEGSRGALPRHQMLRASIDWSYGLLDEKEKALLVRLAIFSGGWTREATEEVCADEE